MCNLIELVPMTEWLKGMFRCLLHIFRMLLATASCDIIGCGVWAVLLLTPPARGRTKIF